MHTPKSHKHWIESKMCEVWIEFSCEFPEFSSHFSCLHRLFADNTVELWRLLVYHTTYVVGWRQVELEIEFPMRSSVILKRIETIMHLIETENSKFIDSWFNWDSEQTQPSFAMSLLWIFNWTKFSFNQLSMISYPDIITYRPINHITYHDAFIHFIMHYFHTNITYHPLMSE